MPPQLGECRGTDWRESGSPGPSSGIASKIYFINIACSCGKLTCSGSWSRLIDPKDRPTARLRRLRKRKTTPRSTSPVLPANTHLILGDTDPSQRAALVSALASIELSRGSSRDQHQLDAAASADRFPQDMGDCEVPREGAPAYCDGSSESPRATPTGRLGQRCDPSLLAGPLEGMAGGALGDASPGGEGEEVGGAQPVRRRRTTTRGEAVPTFELVIASDVIYSVSVVEPLFQTVSDLLAPGVPVTREDGAIGGGDAEAPTLVMCQSFDYDAETEEAIDSACAKHGLVREILWDELARGGRASSSRHVGVSGAVPGRWMSGEGEKDGFVELGGKGRQDAQDRELEESEDRSGTKLQIFRRR